MATNRRSLTAVFVIVLSIGAAVFFTASRSDRLPAHSPEPSALSERGITSTPPLAPEIRATDGQSDGDGGRRLPNAFGFLGLTALAFALAAVYAHHQRGRRGPVLALAFAHQGPRTPPGPVTFVL